jgi:hypothetical protein
VSVGKLRRELVDVAALYRFEYVGLTPGGHHKFRHRPTGDLVFHSTTPSDTKSINALRAQFKKIDEGRVPTDTTKQPRRPRKRNQE